MIPQTEWKWFGHAGHLIVGHDCRFHLCTLIGDHLVSTVGEYWPCREVREIHASVHDNEWLKKNRHLKGDNFDAAYMKRFGYEEIGFNRKYETMVFKVTGKFCEVKECACGLPEIDGSELDYLPANDAGKAAANHMKLCIKVASGAVGLEICDTA